ncbi:hypothetical protein SS1G_02568 [Sclerotinia sclerotiorum 1980 UF-70]|uniref:Uncharacterized protein n=1 Tax=Sclerotinia sclerotiorum (strain ATCC 18683 / 1980 / Ss-1) TaxID=665079 RepID=A7EB82_SCLS1|nr:hypothetical protein SS1G_02568 [Sclerotinia sclerotiorum 1980 UF-70]EDN99710.1 hypothetical protein SS1G_02568 [Sclerotinia sclerotiorum 1980 UF-70]
MSQRPPSPNAPQPFDEALIPVFRRLGEITLSKIRLRALSIAGFAVTFWALIRGYATVAEAVTSCAGIAAEMSPKQLNIVHFFITQALGIVMEDGGFCVQAR